MTDHFVETTSEMIDAAADSVTQHLACHGCGLTASFTVSPASNAPQVAAGIAAVHQRNPEAGRATPDPQALVTSLEGHLVRVGTYAGNEWTGVMLGGRERGFTIQSHDGIGGRRIFYYFEVKGIDDLGMPS